MATLARVRCPANLTNSPRGELSPPVVALEVRTPVLPRRGSAPPKHFPGLVCVVSAAAQRKIGHGTLTADRIGLDVVDLQEGALTTMPAVRCYECALSGVTLPDGSSDVGRHVARPSGGGADRARLGHRCPLPACNVCQQQLQGPAEDRPRIAIRYLAAQELLRLAQVLVRLAIHSELHAIAFRGQRLNHVAPLAARGLRQVWDWPG